jgi:hypothetical protein
LVSKPGEQRYIFQATKAGVYVVGFVTVGEGEIVFCTITVGGVPPKPPVPPDPPTPPDPPVPPTGTYYFLVVRPDGPASPAFTAAMALPAWGELRTKGHKFKDKTVTEAKALNLELPAGTQLPCVVTLATEGGVSKIVRGPVPLPLTDAAVRALPEGVK